MALSSTPDIYGYTIFCDDIREEAGGKHSFMGTYGGLMIIHVPFPATLVTFAVAVTILQKRKIFEPNLGLWIFLPGDSENEPSIQGKFSEIEHGKVAGATLAETEALHPDSLGRDEPIDDIYVALNAHMKFSQMIMKQPGIVKVRAVIGDNIYRLGAMRVSPPPTQAQPDTANANASQQPS